MPWNYSTEAGLGFELGDVSASKSRLLYMSGSLNWAPRDQAGSVSEQAVEHTHLGFRMFCRFQTFTRQRKLESQIQFTNLILSWEPVFFFSNINTLADYCHYIFIPVSYTWQSSTFIISLWEICWKSHLAWFLMKLSTWEMIFTR